MTEILNRDTLHREFSRKSFLKGGAVVFGSAAIGASLAGKAAAAIDPLANPGIPADPNEFTSYGPADSTQLDSWFVVHPDNSISVKLGKVELGQGSMTGLLMVAAEELNMDMSQMRWLSNDTDVTPNQGTTAGSSSISSIVSSLRRSSCWTTASTPCDRGCSMARHQSMASLRPTSAKTGSAPCP